MQIHPARIHELAPGKPGEGPVVYWMQRDQRLRDNWALAHARTLADRRGVPLVIAFCLVPRFLEAAWRQYAFMIGGLQQVEAHAGDLGIPFFLLAGDPLTEVSGLANELNAGVVVTDFSPLRIAREWKRGVAERISAPLVEVDTHNVVPCREVSAKQEYAARTIRPRINRRLAEFMDRLPPLRRQTVAWAGAWPRNDWTGAAGQVKAARSIGPVDTFAPGEKAARRQLRRFLDRRLANYATGSNDPNTDSQSGLSPYLHFGQLGAQRVAAEVLRWDRDMESRGGFLEQLIIRRELSDNYCLHNPCYDSLEGCPDWALRTLEDHLGDRREHLYTEAQFEAAETHDELWNAAQMEMVVTGKMHGYLRMYWAKKILEWTEHPAEAHRIALTLNDSYQLDGRDPNGYVGVAWSIGGLHDRPWTERPVFGKIRYMNYNGCRRKFNVARYISRVTGLQAELDLNGP